MTLGRTASNAIKIKTDGTTRAVNCGCCGGGCLCDSATPINPPSDPDFTKKLTGNDPNVAPFTQVSISYNITVNSRTASGTMSGSWVDAIVLDPEGEYRCEEYIGGPINDPSSYLKINKVFVGDDCDFDDFCLGLCEQYQLEFDVVGVVDLRLREDGCLAAGVSEQFFGGYFYLSKECPDRILSDASVSINGVSTYTVYEVPSLPGDNISGFLNITFS